MESDNEFEGALLRRIEGYRAIEHKVRRRHEELGRELETLRSRRQAAEELFSAEFGPVPQEALGPSSETQSELTAPPHQQVEGALTGLSWEDAIKKVLYDGQPQHVKEIWARLSNGGFRTGAKDPLRSIVTMAIRNPGIVKAGPNIYALGGHTSRHSDPQPEGGRDEES